MKKSLLIFGLMSLGLAHAQQGRTHAQHRGAQKRIGINTEKPVASLEVVKVSGVPATQVQGFLLPHLNQTERNAMEQAALVNGLMIFNTTKNCIDWWDGAHWQCTDGSLKDTHGNTQFTYTATQSYTGNASFTRNNCPAGQNGESVVYNATAQETATSNVSQADAENKARQAAQAKYNRDGQAYANTNGRCISTITTYTATKTESYSKDFYKTSCPINHRAVEYSHSERATATRTSTVSQAEADRLATQAARAEAERLVLQNGQRVANTNGECSTYKVCNANTVGTYIDYGFKDGTTTRLYCRTYQSQHPISGTPTTKYEYFSAPVGRDGVAIDPKYYPNYYIFMEGSHRNKHPDDGDFAPKLNYYDNNSSHGLSSKLIQWYQPEGLKKWTRVGSPGGIGEHYE